MLGVCKSHKMHSLHINRYFENTPNDPHSITIPMLYQQCKNAPCKNVCPIVTTSHSPENLNNITYNHCIDTHYYTNNYPYKVHHFNFFNYSKNFVGTQQMQLNPKVTIRSRNVMEKCTWYVQHI